MLNLGVNINIGQEQGSTALHCAALGGHHTTVTLLLNNGANVNAQDRSGQTPLHLAAQSGNVETGKFLVEAGAMLEAITISGETSMHYAAFWGKKEFIKFLLENGANYKAISNQDKTPSQRAIDNNHKNTSRLIKNYHQEVKLRMPRRKQEDLLPPVDLAQLETRTQELEEENHNLQQQIELLEQEKQDLNQQINDLEQKNKKILPEVSAGIAAASAILAVAFFVYPFEAMKALQYVGVIPLTLVAHFAGNRIDRDYERAIGFFNNRISPAIGYAFRTISAGIGVGASRGAKPLVEVHDNNGIQPQGTPLVHAEGEVKAPVDFNVVGIAPQKAPLVNAQVRAPVNANAPVKIDAPVKVEAQGGGVRFGL